jgi:hypothetical protein
VALTEPSSYFLGHDIGFDMFLDVNSDTWVCCVRVEIMKLDSGVYI